MLLLNLGQAEDRRAWSAEWSRWDRIMVGGEGERRRPSGLR